jgi:DNA-binding transcriptional regulator YiaG
MDNIKELRKAKGLTRDQLAALMEVSASCIWNWEQNKPMHKKYQRKLEKILGGE